MNKSSKKPEILRRIHSFRYAFRGLIHAIRTQPNMRIHLTLGGIVIIAGLYFKLSLLEWISISLVIGLVLSAELFNSAIEELTNLVSPDYNKKAGHVKDLAAGAVLITAIIAVIVGLIIFIPKILLLV